MILSTVNVPLNWQALYERACSERKTASLSVRFYEPIPVVSFDLIAKQKIVTGTAQEVRYVVRKMIEFCARHEIETVTENFKMSEINEAFDHLESGKARYRIVLENDF